MADLAHQFLAALRAGRACLHPTDTLPGLTFDPTSATGREAVAQIKGRAEAKPYLALVCSVAKARRYFQPLPGTWERLLTTLWPGPLSVVWEASPAAPPPLVAADGTIGLRVPLLPVEAAWFRAVLEAVDLPLPTTSVNRSGEPPAFSFPEAALRLALASGSFVPPWTGAAPAVLAPSTVIRIHRNGAYSVLRAGALDPERLAAQVRLVG